VVSELSSPSPRKPFMRPSPPPPRCFCLLFSRLSFPKGVMRFLRRDLFPRHAHPPIPYEVFRTDSVGASVLQQLDRVNSPPPRKKLVLSLIPGCYPLRRLFYPPHVPTRDRPPPTLFYCPSGRHHLFFPKAQTVFPLVKRKALTAASFPSPGDAP